MALAVSVSAGTAGEVDMSFDPPTVSGTQEPIIDSLTVQADGKILFGGIFSEVGSQARRGLARLNPDGSVDTSFVNPDVDGVVLATALQTDGKVLIGGSFTSVQDEDRSNVARLNIDGTLDETFADPKVDGDISDGGAVYSLTQQSDGKILIAGTFNSVDGQPRARVARLGEDGALDTSFGDPEVESSSDITYVNSVTLQANGKVLIGGIFESVGGVARHSIARLNVDGSLDTTFTDPDVEGGDVMVITLQEDGKILIGGYFTDVGGQPRSYVARLNSSGSLDTSFSDLSVSGDLVLSLVAQLDGQILIGGWFSSVKGRARSNIARLNADGTLDSAFARTSVNNRINSLALQTDGRILAGGQFTRVNDQERDFLVRFLGGAGPPPSATHELSVAKAGTGQGTVTSSPAGIACGSTCQANFDEGTNVTLSASAASDSTFAGWSGACSGTGSCAVTMSETRSVTATFRAVPPPPPPTATVTVSGLKAKVNRKSVVVTSRVKLSGAGRIAQRATTGKGRKTRTWCRASKTVSAAGTHTLQCNLGSKGRKALRKGSLKLTLRTTFTPTAGEAVTANLKLTVKRKR